jgi:hypothetical protein
MIIYGKFLTMAGETEADMEPAVHECQQNCIDSAGQAIDLIHDTFQNDSFFQTWYMLNPLCPILVLSV